MSSSTSSQNDRSSSTRTLHKRKRHSTANAAESNLVEKPEATTRTQLTSAQAEDDDTSVNESDEGLLVHESLIPSTSKQDTDPSSSKKYTPPGETLADRDRRTVFVGNLPIEVAKAKVSLSLYWEGFVLSSPSLHYTNSEPT